MISSDAESLQIVIKTMMQITKRFRKQNCYLQMLAKINLALLLFSTMNPSWGAADSIVRIGTNVWPGYEPLYLARTMGYFDTNSIRLVEYPSATEVLRAFRSHTLEAASLTLDEVLMLREANIPIKVVLVHDVSDGGDAIMARKEIDRFSELRGKRVAVETGALGAYMITRALELNNMKLDEIHVVNLDIDSHETAYITGEVDAVVTFEPVRTKLMAVGAQELFNSRQIPGEIVDVLVVHEDVLNVNQKHILRELIDGWFKALDLMRQQPEKAYEILSRRMKIEPDRIRQCYYGLKLPDQRQNKAMLGGRSPTLQTVLRKLQDAMLAQKLIVRSVSLENLLYDGLVQ